MPQPDADLDTDVWLEVPMEWSPETWTDVDGWSSEAAAAVSPEAADEEWRALAAALARCATSFPSTPLSTTYIHLPADQVLPLPVEVRMLPMSAAGALREQDLARADDVQAVEKPLVEAFAVPHGRGFRVLRYLQDADTDGQPLIAAVHYLVRLPIAAVDVSVSSATFDLPRLLRAVDDIDALVVAVTDQLCSIH